MTLREGLEKCNLHSNNLQWAAKLLCMKTRSFIPLQCHHGFRSPNTLSISRLHPYLTAIPNASFQWKHSETNTPKDIWNQRAMGTKKIIEEWRPHDRKITGGECWETAIKFSHFSRYLLSIFDARAIVLGPKNATRSKRQGPCLLEKTDNKHSVSRLYFNALVYETSTCFQENIKRNKGHFKVPQRWWLSLGFLLLSSFLFEIFMIYL